MADRTTINVSKESHRRAKEAKEDGESWSDYLLRCIDEEAHGPVGDLEPFGGEVPEIDTDSVVDRIVHELEMGGTPESEIESVVTDLEAEIKKAQELAEQARDNTDDLKKRLG